jgi:hypothetical protein
MPSLIPFRDLANYSDGESQADSLGSFLSLKVRAEMNKAHSKSFVSWEDSNCMLITSFLSDLSSMIVTEAAVERSFQCQSDIQQPRRCRMKPELADAILFIRMNMDKLNYFPSGGKVSNRSNVESSKKRMSKKEKAQKRSVLPEADWNSLILKCGTGDWLPTRILTRRQKHNALIKKLRVGSRVEIEWLVEHTDVKTGKVSKTGELYPATVIFKDPEDGSFQVIYDGEKEWTPFLPNSKDLQFAFIEESDQK